MRVALLLILVTLAGAAAAVGQANTDAKTVAEVRAFYDGYAKDLREHRRESIADRYDARGTYLLGNGSKSLETLADNRRFYMTKWTGPKSFAWKDMEFEVVSPTAVVVISRFEWAAEKEPKPVTCSYTGLVIKASDGVWRIRVEDESCPPPKQ